MIILAPSMFQIYIPQLHWTLEHQALNHLSLFLQSCVLWEDPLNHTSWFYGDVGLWCWLFWEDWALRQAASLRIPLPSIWTGVQISAHSLIHSLPLSIAVDNFQSRYWPSGQREFDYNLYRHHWLRSPQVLAGARYITDLTKLNSSDLLESSFIDFDKQKIMTCLICISGQYLFGRQCKGLRWSPWGWFLRWARTAVGRSK